MRTRKEIIFPPEYDGAIIYTLVAMAKLHSVEPFAYLKDVLTRLPDYPYNKRAELLPQNW